MRTIHPGKLNGDAGDIAQGLGVFGFGVVMVGNIEVQRAPQGHIEDLEAATDGQEGQPLLDRLCNGCKFPGVAGRVRFLDQAGIGNRLAQEFPGNIGTSGE